VGDFYLPNASLPLPIFKNNVAIQYLGLHDQQESETLKNVLKEFGNQEECSFHVWVAPSGTGKSHELLKLACNYHALFFTGATRQEQGLIDPLLQNIITMSEKNQNQQPPNLYTEYLTTVCVLVKLLWLLVLCNTKKDAITPRECFFSQLNKSQTITAEVMKLVIDMNPSFNLIKQITEEQVQQLRQQYGITLCCVIDEAYVLSTKHSCCYKSYNKESDRYIFTPFTKAVSQIIKKVVIAGTKISVQTEAEAVSAVAKISIQQIKTFSPFFCNKAEDVVTTLSRMISLDDECVSFLNTTPL